MAPRPTGTLDSETQADGTLAFRLRFRAYGERQTVFLHERRDCNCRHGCGGGWTERTARVELRNIIARVEAGIWQKPPRREVVRSVAPPETPLFDDYIEYWLTARFSGVLGERPLRTNTRRDYRWRAGHLKQFFGRYRLDEIDGDVCLRFKAHKLREAQALREALQAGADLRDTRNHRVVPLGPASLKKLLAMLATVLGDAIEDGHLDANPARSHRLRIHVPKPRRTFLEIDELVCLEDVARGQDPPLALFRQAAMAAPAGSTRATVTWAASEGKSQAAIAGELRLAKGSISYHLKRLNLGPIRYVGRGAIVSTLGHSGTRVGELCALKIGELRLHDPERARFLVTDAKTETGIREVEMSPELVEVILAHIDRLRRYGRSTTPEDYVFQNNKGRRMSRQSINKVLTEAAVAASETLCKHDLPALPHTTPQSMAPHLHIHRAFGEQLRRPMGHEAGRPRRLEDDPRGLRAAPAARQTRERR